MEKDLSLKEERKRQMEMYKGILDSQVNYNKELSQNGNMTNVEKRLNKHDLIAYKNYDKEQHALIPGLNRELPKNRLTQNFS